MPPCTPNLTAVCLCLTFHPDNQLTRLRCCRKLFSRVVSALMWEAATLAVVALLLGCLYGALLYTKSLADLLSVPCKLNNTALQAATCTEQ